MAEVSTGMERAVMKRVIGQSGKDAPVHCAFALGNDKRTALAVFDKIKPPRSLSTDLSKLFPEAKSPSFGTAFQDPADDTLLNLTVNKIPPGLGRRLLRTLKGTGLKRLSFFDEQGTLLESVAADEDEEGTESGHGGDGASVQGSGLVGKRAFLIERWKKIPGELRVEVAAINAHINQRLPHEDADAFCAQMTGWFDDMVGEMQSRLDDAIDSAINAGDQSYRPVAAALEQFHARVANDELIAFMKQSDLLDGATVAAAFTRAFDEIGAELTR